MASILKIVSHGGPTTLSLSDYIGKYGEFLLDPDTGQILFLDGETPGGTPIGGSGSLPGFASVIDAAPPNDSVNTSIIGAVGGTSDMDITILPAGAGGLGLSVPDGTSLGGNKRGPYAVDLQIFAAGKNSPTEVASGPYSFACGSGNTSSGPQSFAEGVFNISSNVATHAEGFGNVANNFASHVEGEGNFSTGSSSHAEGTNNTASGDFSHAEGNSTTASGIYSHAEGQGTLADGSACHAEGNGTTAHGNFAHAEGNGTTASGDYSHAEGGVSLASASFAHAEGSSTASGNAAHSEGFQTVASGGFSHAEGRSTTADGDFSQSSGLNSWTRGIYGYQAYSTGQFATLGDQQSGRLGLIGTTIDAVTVTLTSDGNPPSTTNQIILPTGSAARINGVLLAASTAGDVSSWSFSICLKNIGGTTSVVGVPEFTTDFQDTGASSWLIALSNDDTNKAFALTVTGGNSTTIHWTAEVRSQELVTI